LLFYIPQAAVVIYLSNRMPLEGGIYQWAKLGFNEFAGFIVAWNLWLLSITVIALGGMFVTTNISYAIGQAPPGCREQMVRVADQRRIGRRSRLGACSWSLVRQMGSQRWRVCDVRVYGALILLPLLAWRAAN
jgi:amino acid transporter